MPKTRTWYMHTLDGKPASYYEVHGSRFLAFAASGHRSRAAKLVPSLRQLGREQNACIADVWREWRERSEATRGPKPLDAHTRYGYVLVAVPA